MAALDYVNFWAPGAIYDSNDIVKQSNEFYYSLIPHVSNSFDTSVNFGGYYQINSIRLPYFLWKPSYSSQVTSSPKVKKVKFGDGYEQRIKSSINNNLLEFSLSFDNRNDKEAKAILHFLHARKGAGLFYWLPYSPFQEMRIFVCPEWKHTRNFHNNNTITAKFVEKPLLPVLSLPIIIEPPPVNTLLDSLVIHWKLSEQISPNRAILPSNILNSYNLTFFKMQDATINGVEMPLNSDTPLAFPGSSYCENIDKNNPLRNIWYKHPWGGLGLSVADSNIVNPGNLDFTHAGWFKLNTIAQVSTETIMPRGLFTIASNATWSTNLNTMVEAVESVPPFRTIYISGSEIRCLTDVSTNISTFEWAVWDINRVKRTVSIGSLSANTWYFFICGYDRVNKRIFSSINGGTIQYTSIPAAPGYTDTRTAGAALMYCRDNFYTYLTSSPNIYRSAAPLQGRMVSFSRWNRLLTDAEIATLYNLGIGKEYPFFP